MGGSPFFCSWTKVGMASFSERAFKENSFVVTAAESISIPDKEFQKYGII